MTQPTLSHDLKVLSNAKVVTTRREGQNVYYTLNTEKLKKLEEALHEIFSVSDDCICRSVDVVCESGEEAV